MNDIEDDQTENDTESTMGSDETINDTNADSETMPDLEADTEVEAESAAEPQPEWPIAFLEWGPAWEIHVYFYASVFVIIAAMTIFSMACHLTRNRRRGRYKLTIALQILLLEFTLLRAVCLFGNPYQTVSNRAPMVFFILWSLAVPGLTASFSVLLLVLIDLTKMSVGPPLFQRLPVLFGITAFHFAMIFSLDLSCVFDTLVCKHMMFVCDLLYILYGLFLAIGYGYTARFLYKNISIHRIQRKESRGVMRNGHYRKTMMVVKVCIAASIVSLSIAATHVYSASSTLGVYSDVQFVDAWQWWIVQTAYRVEEVASAVIIVLMAFRNTFCQRGYRLRRLLLQQENALSLNIGLTFNMRKQTFDEVR
ncbi:hypothetical protein MAR_027226 [Mya arenaria]|uniref:Proline-rich transmembrane protein 3/4 domain-containing protein n=1 Tax=Mya arenaria TaxID=6604 RepID=A0ABY7F104_MYAAR|nr:hypothetical protein MAR_027226 [Mya arenaria]